MAEDGPEDTIAAVATPVGEGGLAVVRVSGPQAFSLIRCVFRPYRKARFNKFPSHTLHVGEILGKGGDIIDQVVVGIFRSPHSYTGEDVIEISCHGGIRVTQKILERVIEEGARHAEPGEFTKRAFLNGKIDLTQAEAILDLIRAKSDCSLKTAVQQLAGNLSHRIKELKDELMRVYAHMEAFLDFPEEDLEVYSDQQIGEHLGRVVREIDALAATFRRGSLMREGLRAAIVGRPNVGKSSLFNALLATERALVSEYPGTTRDRLEEWMEIKGMAVCLMDTAGLSEAILHPVDRMGMESTRRLLHEADLFLCVVDGSEPLTAEDRRLLEELPQDRAVLVLINKSDLPLQLDPGELARCAAGREILKISSKTREGLSELEEKIFTTVSDERLEAPAEQITRLRHRQALETASEFLKRVQTSLQAGESLECVILDLKTALNALRELIGEVYSEDLLDVIFSEFCIGK